MTGNITIEYDTDESFVVRAGGNYVGSVNHDRDGWEGMANVRNIVCTLARVFGIRVVEEGVPNV